MFSELNSYLTFFVLCLSFLNASDLSKALLTRFLFGYLNYLVHFLFKLSYYYFKFIGVFLIWYKALFFSNLIPTFIQLIFSFHFLFNFIWDMYLLLIIYSSILVCLPIYVLNFNTKKTNCLKAELKSIIILIFFLYFNFEIVLATFTNLVCIDKLLLNRKTFISMNEYDLMTKTFTEKSLSELQLHVLENYDETKIKFNKKQKYDDKLLDFTF